MTETKSDYFFEILFNSRCILGIAEYFNLSILDLVTRKGSLFLVFTLLGFRGNMFFVRGFLVHFRANFSISCCLLALSVVR